MKKLIILLVAIYISLTGYPQDWIQLTTATTAHINSISFINDSVGVAVGAGGTILLTNNGGSSWYQISVNFDKSLNHVCHINDTMLIAVGDSAAVFKSVNGGLTWHRKVIRNLSANLLGVSFTPSGKGVAVGVDETIVLSGNYGDSWAIKRTGYWGVDNRVLLLNDTTGYIFGTNAIPEPLVTYSYDGFSTLLFRDFYPFYHNVSYLGYLYDGYLIDSTQGVFVGTTELANGFVTTQLNWVQQQWNAILYQQQLYAVSAKDSIFIAGGCDDAGKAFFLQSNNYGVSWTGLTLSEVNAVINDIFFTPNCVYAAATNGVILKKTFNTSRVSLNRAANISIYPNPAHNSVYVHLAKTTGNDTDICFIAANGNEIKKHIVNSVLPGNILNIDTDGLCTGLYVVKLITGKDIYINKIMIIR